MAPLNRIALVLIASCFLVGCDPISHTEIALRPNLPGSSQSTQDEIIRVVSKTAAEFGLEEDERGNTDTTYSDSHSRVGQNPKLWLAVKHSSLPASIEITEAYIDHPTGNHKELAQTLVRDLNASGYNATITHQTPDARRWPWVLGGAFSVFGLAAWTVLKKRTLKGRGTIDSVNFSPS